MTKELKLMLQTHDIVAALGESLKGAHEAPQKSSQYVFCKLLSYQVMIMYLIRRSCVYFQI